MRPMNDSEIRAMQERVWVKIGPFMRPFCYFIAAFFALYLVCGFFGEPTNFTRHAYWTQLFALAIPLCIYAYFGIFSKQASKSR
jgi:hypothetical protein